MVACGAIVALEFHSFPYEFIIDLTAFDFQPFPTGISGAIQAWALQRGFLTAKAARPDVYRAANSILRYAGEFWLMQSCCSGFLLFHSLLVSLFANRRLLSCPEPYCSLKRQWTGGLCCR